MHIPYTSDQSLDNYSGFYPKLNSLITRKTFNPITTTFQELVSPGNIGIIQDKSIKREVIRFYNKMERISMVISNNNIHVVDGIYQSIILEYTIMIKDEYDEDLEKMNENIIGEKVISNLKVQSNDALTSPLNRLHVFNALEQRTFVAMGHVKHYKKLQDDTENLISLIKNTIE